jgi:hypothetical protein
MKNIVLVFLDRMVGQCVNCQRVLNQEIVVHLVAAGNRYQLDGGIPPVRHLYCKGCWDRLVERANQEKGTVWPDSCKLGVSAPHGKYTRQWFVLSGDVEDPLERFRDSATCGKNEG